jgi:hypothetical protein
VQGHAWRERDGGDLFESVTLVEGCGPARGSFEVGGNAFGVADIEHALQQSRPESEAPSSISGADEVKVEVGLVRTPLHHLRKVDIAASRSASSPCRPNCSTSPSSSARIPGGVQSAAARSSTRYV